MIGALPLPEHERTSANRTTGIELIRVDVRRCRQGMLRHDRRLHRRNQKRTIGRLERNGKCGFVGCVVAGDVAETAAVGSLGFGVPDRIKRELHVVSGEGLAVVPGHIGLNVERPLQAIAGLVPTGRQARDGRASFGVGFDQTFEHQLITALRRAAVVK